MCWLAIFPSVGEDFKCWGSQILILKSGLASTKNGFSWKYKGTRNMKSYSLTCDKTYSHVHEHPASPYTSFSDVCQCQLSCTAFWLQNCFSIVHTNPHYFEREGLWLGGLHCLQGCCSFSVRSWAVLKLVPSGLWMLSALHQIQDPFCSLALGFCVQIYTTDNEKWSHLKLLNNIACIYWLLPVKPGGVRRKYVMIHSIKELKI